MQILDVALQGMQAAEQKLEVAAVRLSQVGDPSSAVGPDVVDIATEMLNMMVARAEHAVNVKSLEAANEMVKHTTDLLA